MIIAIGWFRLTLILLSAFWGGYSLCAIKAIEKEG